jgi:hypothetical protein
VSLSSDAGEGQMLTAGAELDLTDPANREVALRLLNPRTLGGAIPDLVERLQTDGRLTLDLFDLSREETEGGVKIGLGVGGGGDASQSSEEQTATGSFVREPGGTFQERICLD